MRGIRSLRHMNGVNNRENRSLALYSLACATADCSDIFPSHVWCMRLGADASRRIRPEGLGHHGMTDPCRSDYLSPRSQTFGLGALMKAFLSPILSARSPTLGSSSAGMRSTPRLISNVRQH